MRRRRRDNNTLYKTMLIALGIVILMLPILGYLGAFKAVKEQYMEVTMIKLPPPPPMEKQAQAKKAHPKTQTHHGGQTHVAGSTRPVSVHVAAAAPSANSSDDNSIVNSNNTNIGAPPGAAAAPPPVTAPPAAAPTPPPAAPPTPTPAPAPAAPTPVTPDEAASVVASSQVKPEIPDELRDSDLDTQFKALFTVHPDGSADVKMVSSTGNNQLDALALDAAKQWKFQPAIHDGKPVQSFLRLIVEFQVS